MRSRYVIAPAPIVPLAGDFKTPQRIVYEDKTSGPYVVDLRLFIQRAAMRDERYRASVPVLAAAGALLAALAEDALPADRIVVVAEDEWQLALDAMQKPTHPLPEEEMHFMMACRVFYFAWLDAKIVDPRTTDSATAETASPPR